MAVCMLSFQLVRSTKWKNPSDSSTQIFLSKLQNLSFTSRTCKELICFPELLPMPRLAVQPQLWRVSWAHLMGEQWGGSEHTLPWTSVALQLSQHLGLQQVRCLRSSLPNSANLCSWAQQGAGENGCFYCTGLQQEESDGFLECIEWKFKMNFCSC